MCIPFRSNFSISALSATAWATTSAAASVISPNDRLSSWKKSCMREHCEMEETQRETMSWAAIVYWPWGLAVLLSGLQRGRQLPQNGPDSHQNWSLGCSWDASEPIRPSEFGDTVKHRIKVLSAYRKLLKKIMELTCAMGSEPFLVKVLSLRLRTRSSGLCRMAEANAITPE